MGEHLVPDARHAGRDRHARKAAATPKGRIPDTRHAAADRHVRKTAAIGERFIPDNRNAVADRHARKIVALGKRMIPDARHAVADCHAPKSAVIEERRLPDRRHGLAAERGGDRHCTSVWRNIPYLRRVVVDAVRPRAAVDRFRVRPCATRRHRSGKKHSDSLFHFTFPFFASAICRASAAQGRFPARATSPRNSSPLAPWHDRGPLPSCS